MITILAALAVAAGALGLILSAAYLARVRRVRWEQRRIAELTALLDAADCVTQAGLARAGEAIGPPPLPDRLRHGRDVLRVVARRRPRL